MPYRTIHRSHHHFGWDNALQPVVEVAPGDSLELEVLEASGGRIGPSSQTSAVLSLDPEFANPVTGPVRVAGAEPGDTLVVDLLDLQLSGWGWTALIPDFGLLADEFPDPFLHITRHDREQVEFTADIRLPTRPFTGTIGVAPAEPGRHSAIPPRAVGGNLDCPDIVAGARLYLPVQVPGALFSVGDTHAAQGDGEVCGTAIESPMTVALRFDLVKGLHTRSPRIELPATAPPRHRPGDVLITTGVAADLMVAARDAVREMIDYLQRERGLGPELAYCLCSTAADLRISEIVNAPNWVVSAYLPLSIFR
jgi:acetamidase/formamidase